jgi:hypothetical protein
MELSDRICPRDDTARIVLTHDESDLRWITSESVQAVICDPAPLPAWFGELAAAVRSGALRIPRLTLHDADRREIERCFERVVPAGVPSPEVRSLLLQDLLRLVDRLAAFSGAARFMLRIFTESPTTECGFHVDTVPPGAPPWGLLRVYNGAGTAYVEPTNLTSMADFYRYLGRRERLEREYKLARRVSDAAACERLGLEIAEVDGRPSFLFRSDEIRMAPAGAIVAFKHVDIADYWSDRILALPWIHCSPMSGESRLVINVTTTEPVRHNARRARAASRL